MATSSEVVDTFQELADRVPGYGVTLRELDAALKAEGIDLDPDDVDVLGIGSHRRLVESLKDVDGETVHRDGMIVWLPVDGAA